MYANDKARLAEAWIGHVRLDMHTQEALDSLWSWEQLNDLAEADPELCWEIVLAILERDSSSDIAEILGGDVVEDLLAFHGESFIARALSEAEANPAFRAVLRAVWWRDEMDPEVWDRVRDVKHTLA